MSDHHRLLSALVSVKPVPHEPLADGVAGRGGDNPAVPAVVASEPLDVATAKRGERIPISGLTLAAHLLQLQRR
jgi:hypothetical protein